MYKKVILGWNRDKSLQRKHPWLFSGAIARQDENIKEGDLVSVYSIEKEYLATGYWQNDTIAVKILTFDEEPIDQKFFNRVISQAVKYRESLGLFSDEKNNIFRLINSEGDFLSGLIADYYDGNIVLQFHSVGMYLMKDFIVKALVDNVKNLKTIFSKSSSTLPKKENIETKDEFLYSTSEEDYFIAKENDCNFIIDYKEGQKTGFFIDQASNRKLLSSLSKDKKVLNCFGYTGGFSVAALKGGASFVTTLDISKKAIDICNKNIENNSYSSKHEAKVVDVLEYLDNIKKGEYDIIVLDPPAFAKHNRDLVRALKGYRTINKKAMEKIKSGGLLFTFSCSQAVKNEDFITMLFSSAALSNRKVRIVRKLPHNFDHPQSIFHPEGEYLKGVLLYVE
ncbi:MAG: class I SAM-dependent rRNA methyltransferase [Bacteroidales bacterium]|nr:class I SAM-dependent rRNA methyltransferase [Bacteroidales bacterium]